jgi:hypothetical protein
MIDQTVPDHQWWQSSYAEFEDFIGIGEERTKSLADKLTKDGASKYIINRLLAANNLPHGPCNAMER